MRALLQRVSAASVRVAGEEVGRVGPGLLVLLGVGQGDEMTDADKLAEKTLNLRIFNDEQGQMNRSILDLKGEILVVSQFTLYADVRRGRRPSYAEAAPSILANRLYEGYLARLRTSGLRVEAGVFGATMEVALVNQGPVTLLLDSRHLS